MKLTKFCVVCISSICIGSLSACTTVDLSQIAIKESQEAVQKSAHNVVEQAALSLTNLFKAKGWCKSHPAEKTRTAANVLLNGVDMDVAKTPVPVAKISTRQLFSDLNEAKKQVEQTTKAAEVYLVLSEEMAELDAELSHLEAALLAAREAEASFEKSMQAASNLIVRHKFTTLSNSIDELKNVTDAYGERIRSQIAARAASNHS